MRVCTYVVGLSLASMASLLMPPRSAVGAGITFEKIVETGQSIPGLGVPVNKLMYYPTTDGLVVVFGVATPKPGIYAYDLTSKSFSKVANTTDAVPGSGGNFAAFADAQMFVSQGKVAFHGTTTANPSPSGMSTKQGIYLKDGGSIVRVVDPSIPIPGGAGNFLNGTINLCSINADGITFTGRGSNTGGIYKYGTGSEPLATVVKTGTTVPGSTQQFTSFGESVLGACSFRGAGGAFASLGPTGVYRTSSGVVSKIANPSTVAPGTSEKFKGFVGGTVSFDGTNVAFTGLKNDGSYGVYAWRQNGLQKVADFSTQIPAAQAGVRFSWFPFFTSIDRGSVAFTGQSVPKSVSSVGKQGIYIGTSQGKVVKVVDGGASLDGHAPSQLIISAQALRSRRLAFFVRSGTWEAIYAARIPAEL